MSKSAQRHANYAAYAQIEVGEPVGVTVAVDGVPTFEARGRICCVHDNGDAFYLCLEQCSRERKGEDWFARRNFDGHWHHLLKWEAGQ